MEDKINDLIKSVNEIKLDQIKIISSINSKTEKLNNLNSRIYFMK